ncbi:MAG: T9SS type A sorting domain-containing protein [Saprospiraceae bacterium]|jgi:hypothetical protein|nr:T9SS type A sorting domain-containing protein [Saprospiraceae bacterium]
MKTTNNKQQTKNHLILAIVFIAINSIPAYAQEARNPPKFCLNSSNNIQVVKMYVNIHFILTGDGHGNYRPSDNDLGNTSVTGITTAQDLVNSMTYKIRHLEPMLSKRIDGSNHPHIADLGLEYELYTDPNDPADIYGGIWFHNYNEYDTTMPIPDSDPDFLPSKLKTLFSHYGEQVLDIFIIGSRFYNKSGVKIYSIGGETENLGSGSAVRVHNNWVLKEREGYDVSQIYNTISHEIMHLVAGFTHDTHTYTDPITGIKYTREIAESPDINKDDEVINSNNIMSYNGCSCAMTSIQFTGYRNVLTNNKRPWVVVPNACVTRNNPIVISTGSNVIWDFYQELDQNVEIESGATLRITCDQRTNAKFIVKRGAKLIVDGCTISNFCPTDYWPGIEVWGNPGVSHPTGDLENFQLDPNGPGVVVLKAATLIKPVDGVYTGNKENIWNSEYWGGIVQARSTDFLGHRRGVAFYPYKRDNSSRFDDCAFNSYTGYAGITMWDVHKIRIEDCRFEAQNISNTPKVNGITSIDATPIIIHSEFFGVYHGINAKSTTAQLLSDFTVTEKSWFHGNVKTDFYSDGILGLLIEKSRYDSTYRNIHFIGNSKYNVENNIFTSYEGRSIESDNTRDRSKLIYYNYFFSNYSTAVRSLYFRLVNYNLQFKSNCFNNPITDVETYANSKMYHQGAVSEANNNYFHVYNFEGAELYDYSFLTPYLQYHILKPELNPAVRAIPHCYKGSIRPEQGCVNRYSKHDNILESVSASSAPPYCPSNGGLFTGDFIDPVGPELYPNDINLLIDQYTDYKTELSLYETEIQNYNQGSNEWNILNGEISLSQYHIGMCQDKIIQFYINESNYVAANNFLTSEAVLDEELIRAGLEFRQGNYSISKSIINTLAASNPLKYGTYALISNIHLDFLMNPTVNFPTQSDSIFLEDLAIDTSWVASYARGMLRLYYDREVEIPEVLESNLISTVTPKNFSGSVKLKLLNTLVTNQLEFIDISEPENIKKVDYEIFSSNGTKIQNGTLKLNNDKGYIEIEKLPQGFYLISIKNESQALNNAFKFVVK